MYEGGIYEFGFKMVLICVINDYVCCNKLFKDSDDNFFGEDVCEGLIVIIFIKYLDL